jgi:NNP family nitrate/nitrite transporter-like MFS transporter
MRVRDIRRAGHVPSLVAAFGHFDISFMCWVILGALGVLIAEDLHLDPAEKGLMVGMPLVAGSVFRLVIGSLADRLGPARVGAWTLAATTLPLAWGFLAGGSLAQLLGIGFLLGIAGASFAVALPLAGRAFDADHRGLAMGIAGAGNSGTVIAALVAPRLAAHVGWHGAMGLALVPVCAMTIAFVALTRRSPRGPAAGAEPLRRIAATPDAMWLCSLYLVTFGGFVGLVSFLPILLRDTYGLSPVAAANATAACAAAGSFCRPVGGWLADRFGGERVLPTVFAVAATAAVGVSGHPVVGTAVPLAVVLLGALGAGNGAVFQIVPRRFPSSVGAVTGLVGAAGGLGGFLLPVGLGLVRRSTGSYGPGLAAFAVACMLASLALGLAVRRWRTQAVPA